MKIRAIRVAEVGRFASGVAVERLSGGLDVLAGPNEAGKSTLLRALQLALFQRYSSKHRDIEALRPHAGGAPLVEIELEIGDRRWRLRKRFLAQASAELSEIGGATLLRGADAETELARLLGAAGGDGRFGLLWVGQRGVLDAVEPDPLTANRLQAALAREVEAVAGGEQLRGVRARVRRRLDELVTSHTPPRPKGIYDAASKTAAAKVAALATADAAMRHALERLEQLGQLRTREAALTEPAAAATRREGERGALADLDAARAAITRRDLAVARLAAADADHLEKRDRLARFIADVHRLDALAGEATAANPAKAEIEARIEALTRTTQAEAQGLAARRGQLQALDLETKAAMAAAEQKSARARSAELVAREARARTASDRCTALAAEIAGLAATAGLLGAARKLAESIRENEARLGAAAPLVTIAYAAGTKALMHAGGRALTDGEAIVATEPLVIDIAGVGRITVAPGGGEAVEDTRADLAAQQDQLAATLAAAGVPDLAGLEALAQHRRDLEANFAEAAAEQRAQAPEGLEQLARSRADAEQAAQGPEPAPARPRADIAAAMEHLGRELGAAEHGQAARTAELASARELRAGLESASHERHRQMAALAAVLPAALDRGSHRDGLAAAAAQAETAAHAALREHAAWAEAAPDVEGLARLGQALQTAELAVRAAGHDLAAITVDAARIEGELAAARSDDVEARAARLGEEAAAARAEADRLADEVAALQVLDAELSVEESRGRDRYLAPVLKRLAPYLDRVLPGAEPAFNERLGIDGLKRHGAPEALARLSEGTQEQVAVLTRLAFARLFADIGAPVPVILDDALVWADDQRIAAMFAALQAAARHHQVIVLTCRATAFAGLGGTRLAFESWTPDRRTP